MLTTRVDMQISDALDEVLNEAASVFASEEFYKLATMQKPVEPQ